MWKNCFSFVILLMPLSVCSSNISAPLLKEGRTWMYDYHHFEEIETNEGITYEESVFEISYTIQGDTVIGGLTYGKIMQFRDDACRYYAALREDGTTIFCMNSGELNEFVLLEYDPKKFTTIGEICGEYTEQKEVVNINGKEFIRHVYEPVDTSIGKKLVGVEGVGFKDSGLLGMIQDLPTCICDYESFKACYDGGECIFTNDDFYYQTTLEGIKEVYDFKRDNPYGSENSKSKNGGFFDLQGRLSAPPAKGLYIKNGRIELVK